MTESEEIELIILGFLYAEKDTDKLFYSDDIYIHFKPTISQTMLRNTLDHINDMVYLHYPSALMKFKINSAGVHRYEKLKEKQRQEIREKKQNWPKRNWLLVAAIAYVFGLLSPIIVEWSKRKIWRESTQSDKTTPISPDTTNYK